MSNMDNVMNVIMECFPNNQIERIWTSPNKEKVYVALKDNENFWMNKYVLRDWFFNYEKFKTITPWEVDCEYAGCYVFFNHSLQSKKLNQKK